MPARSSTSAKHLGGLGPRDLGVPAAIPWIDSIPKQYRPADLDQNAAFEKLRGRADFQELFRK
jgi:hypothetical protein